MVARMKERFPILARQPRPEAGTPSLHAWCLRSGLRSPQKLRKSFEGEERKTESTTCDFLALSVQRDAEEFGLEDPNLGAGEEPVPPSDLLSEVLLAKRKLKIAREQAQHTTR